VAIDLTHNTGRSGLWHRLGALASAMFSGGADRAIARIEPRLQSGATRGPKPTATATEDALVALILDTVDAAITVYDSDGKLIRANRGAERLSGFTLAEMQEPATWRHIIPGSDFARVMDILGDRRLEDFPIVNVNPWVHKDGTSRLMRWSNVALPDARGGVAMIVCIGFDITDQHQLEMTLTRAKNEAELASRAKSEFLANMSHELRTPLNAILGFSQVIRDRHFGDAAERYSEYAANIHDSGEMLLALITDILEMAKLEAGKLKLAEETVDLGQVIGSCLKMISARAGDGGIILSVDTPAHPLRLCADQRAMKQILLNLLSNAVKFTPQAGKVTVRAGTLDSGEVVLSVADTGIGIHPIAQRSIFQPFFQVDPTATRSRSGTGLGLAITKHLVDLHDGKIEVDSTPGIGTTVTVTLPAARVVRQDRAG
jgi:PAS domain S-box-containing protein